jgi:hypothetical protein
MLAEWRGEGVLAWAGNGMYASAMDAVCACAAGGEHTHCMVKCLPVPEHGSVPKAALELAAQGHLSTNPKVQVIIELTNSAACLSDAVSYGGGAEEV